MKRYLLLKLHFCMLLAFVFSNRIDHLDDLFFQHITLNKCENESIPSENCTDNHHEIDQESGSSNKILHLKLNENVYRIPLYGYESSSVFLPGANVTVENDTEGWTEPISAFEDVPFFEGTDESGTYASGSIINDVFNGVLMPHDGPSIYIESFVVQNDSNSNGSLQLVAYKPSDVKVKKCSNNDAQCREHKFSGSIYCTREKMMISCFSRTDNSGHMSSESIDLPSPIPSLSLQMTNASCRTLITVDKTFYDLHNSDTKSLLSQIVAIFKKVNYVLGSTDFNQDGRADHFSLRIRGVVLSETKAVTKSERVDELTLAKIVDDFREKDQDECMSLLFVAIPTEMNLLSVAYGGGICKSKRPAKNVAIFNMLDARGHTRPLFANAWIVAMSIGHLMGSAERACHPTFPYPPVEDWTAFFSKCGKHNIAQTVKREGSCLLYPKTKVKPQASKQVYYRGALIPIADDNEDNINLTTKDIKPKITDIKPTKEHVKPTKEHVKPTTKDTKSIKKNVRPTKLYVKPTSNSSKLCGNRIIDSGEKCDCGSEEHCKKLQSCCVPPGRANECQYDQSKGYECDWMEPCCTRKCKIVPKSWNKFCGAGDDSCSPKESHCDGKSSFCPVGRSDFILMNGQLCGPGSLNQKGAGTCQDGHCVSTLCKDHNKTDCICPVTSGHSCRICCRRQKKEASKTTVESECVVWKNVSLGNEDKEKEMFYLRQPGTPCDDVRLGLCNKQGRCVQADKIAASTAARLHSLPYAQIHFLATTIILIFYFFIERHE